MDHLGIIDQICHLAGVDTLSIIDDRETLTKLAGHDEILFNQQDRRLLTQRADGFHHLLNEDWRQPFTRFINQQQFVFWDQCPGNGQHLLLPT